MGLCVHLAVVRRVGMLARTRKHVVITGNVCIGPRENDVNRHACRTGQDVIEATLGVAMDGDARTGNMESGVNHDFLSDLSCNNTKDHSITLYKYLFRFHVCPMIIFVLFTRQLDVYRSNIARNILTARLHVTRSRKPSTLLASSIVSGRSAQRFVARNEVATTHSK